MVTVLEEVVVAIPQAGVLAADLIEALEARPEVLEAVAIGVLAAEVLEVPVLLEVLVEDHQGLLDHPQVGVAEEETNQINFII